MKTTLFFFVALWYIPVHGQLKKTDTAYVKGRIIAADAQTGHFEVYLPELRHSVRSESSGRFTFDRVPFGNYMLIVYGTMASDTFRIAVDLDTTDLGTLEVRSKGMTPQEADLFSSLLSAEQATEDPEQLLVPADPDHPMDAAVRAWSGLGYRFRGYDRDQAAVYLNGLPVQDIATGRVPRGLWAGLRGMILSTETAYGLQQGREDYASLAGLSSVYVTAAGQPRQSGISYGLSNGIWTNRLMLHHSTGMGRKGWAMALSAGKCWSMQGYVPGTYYDEYSFYLGLSKRFHVRHSLHLTALATPMESGNTSAVTAEAAALAGSPYYNPNWGLQDNLVRNAKTSKGLQPFFLLNYTYRADSVTDFDLAAGYRFGYQSYSSLDWYNAQDPRPDYYKNLPGAYKDDPATAAQIQQEWQDNPDKQQLNWTGMYEANRLNADSTNRRRSVYAWGADKTHMQQYSLAARFRQKRMHSVIQAGLIYEGQATGHYREMSDLLGGDYYVNVNQFAEKTYTGNTRFNQNDLNHPDRLVYAGDRYGYDYMARHHRATLWSQAMLVYSKISLSLSGHLRYEAYHREGRYRTGMFPDDSYGTSEPLHFFTYLAKAGAGYTFQPGHVFFGNTGISTAAPAFDHSFIAPRSRNTVLERPVPELALSAEAGYRIATRRLKGSLTAFITDRSRITDIRRFYHEDYRSFVNYVMEGIRIRHTGVELALEARITTFLMATAAVAWSQVKYRSLPDVSVYRDNDTSTRIDKHKAYIKDYYTAGPQFAMLAGLNAWLPFRAYAGVRCRLLDRNYAEINPARRTDAAVGLTLPGSPEQERILQQERLPRAFATDISAGKTFHLYKAGKAKLRHAAIALRVGVSNIFNNKNIVTTAYEQLRFDYKGLDPDRFPNKYLYAYGAVYTIDLGLRF